MRRRLNGRTNMTYHRAYYHFHHDNAPYFQTETLEKYFSFTVKIIIKGEKNL